VTRLADRWRKIADALGLRMVAPYRLMLPSGDVVDADLLLRDFGGPNGMLVLSSTDKLGRHGDGVVAAGFGYSVLQEPDDDEDIDLDVVREVLRDWEWTGNEKDKPTWMPSPGES
jgi:hypothetical protein